MSNDTQIMTSEHTSLSPPFFPVDSPPAVGETDEARTESPSTIRTLSALTEIKRVIMQSDRFETFRLAQQCESGDPYALPCAVVDDMTRQYQKYRKEQLDEAFENLLELLNRYYAYKLPTDACRLCRTRSVEKAVFECGHVVCATCANRLNKGDVESNFRCPFCRRTHESYTIIQD